MIKIDKNEGWINLSTTNCSYIIKLFRNQYPLHFYWGKKIPTPGKREFPYMEPTRGNLVIPEPANDKIYIELLPLEYAYQSSGDYRPSSFNILDKHNNPVIETKIKEYSILNEKPNIPGLPCTWAKEGEAQTLKLVLTDSIKNLDIILYYAVIEKYDVIIRWCEIKNNGTQEFYIKRLMSLSMDMLNNNYQFLFLEGAWARERQICKEIIKPGLKQIGSIRGISSHQFNPFFAILDKNADEHKGSVYGFNLVYSGNFIAEVDCNYDKNLRLNLGINPWEFSWNLKPGASFYTPEGIMVYSDTGLNGMSRIFHRFYRERLSKSTWRQKMRPVLINNWEATYFNFNEDKLLKIAESAKQAGIELFVLDDGWFGERENDKTSLGDWFENKRKLPSGIGLFSKEIEKLDLSFGLWFEPEMISKESKLYKEHPDWCLHLPQRLRGEGRNQLVLDLCRKEIRDYIFKLISDILSNASISYIKWDMNRTLSHAGSIAYPDEPQGNIMYRYMLGVYELMFRLTSHFPDILFEGCAAGGGRMDPGILHYMPQFWISDNTDALSRLKIQYATSLVYPPIMMGAHVSDVPNHETGRYTDMEFRGLVASSGSLGYELDLNSISVIDIKNIRDQIVFYKKHRKIIQFGNFIRLLSPFENNTTAWMFITQDKKEALLFHFALLNEANLPPSLLKLIGLDEDSFYVEQRTGLNFSGKELIHRGFLITNKKQDFKAQYFHFKKKNLN